MGGKKEITQKRPANTVLSLRVEHQLIPAFYPLLQKGVVIKGQVGCSLRSFLCDQLGLNAEYVEKRIQTLLLNGKAVDDAASAMAKDGSTIALSAAMPGLLGATLRKGSYYAQMRNQISHTEKEHGMPSKDGWLLVKLFNLLLHEVGPLFLERGIYMGGKDLQDLLGNLSGPFWRGCVEAVLNGKKIDPLEMAEMEWPDGQILLKIEVL